MCRRGLLLCRSQLGCVRHHVCVCVNSEGVKFSDLKGSALDIWDACPLAGKYQIIAFIGLLEVSLRCSRVVTCHVAPAKHRLFGFEREDRLPGGIVGDVGKRSGSTHHPCVGIGKRAVSLNDWLTRGSRSCVLAHHVDVKACSETISPHYLRGGKPGDIKIGKYPLAPSAAWMKGGEEAKATKRIMEVSRIAGGFTQKPLIEHQTAEQFVPSACVSKTRV